jgi:hypothetical protein
MFKLIRKAAALARMWPTLDLSCKENAAAKTESKSSEMKKKKEKKKKEKEKSA